ncbi:MAG: 2-oxo acid dehydrogenase subunit E2 [Simkaniaceae bacterium]|nr:2-oxo acid dehydrogenase subunit E2 [Simkaniaceae bacterium]
MNDLEVKMPKLGESIVSATITQWLKKEGDFVDADEPLLEVTTDKVNSEIPAPSAGRIKAILRTVEEECDVGEVICLIEGADAPFHSPAVKAIAKEHAVDLSTLSGSGEGGRITKKDVEKQVSTCTHDRIPLTGMRKAIAENMVRSFYKAPHATFINEVDVTDVETGMIDGVKVTITAVMVRAIARALEQFPHLNASLVDDHIVLKKQVNVGIAVSVDQAVMVPVIRDCQSRDLSSIARQIAHLAEKARSNSLAPEDVQEGTITLTNFGMTGVSIGVPIIRHPEVAIIGLGAMQKKVVAMPDNSIAIRKMVNVTLTFDHRVLDGIYACGFLNALNALLTK